MLPLRPPPPLLLFWGFLSDSRSEGAHQPRDRCVLSHVLHSVVKGLSGSGYALMGLGKNAGGEVLEGLDAGEGRLKVVHLASGLLGLLPDVAGQALDAGPQGRTRALQLLGDVPEHAERLGLHLLEGEWGGVRASRGTVRGTGTRLLLPFQNRFTGRHWKTPRI